ncbi:MarR family winged helix-turn-helix transcriptional regulator [Arthrobacter castelli]|uniref:MarR family winged helix-turn-helix transcriptional regulator n=1 Tax=Arthrobacter castelli TaxID=271431 RepID=UPI0004066F2E|nr:MarR family transcriptional regulator [Arthrobacter castelli]
MTNNERDDAGIPDNARPLLLLLQQFTVESNRFVDQLSGKHHLHRTDLNALAAIIAFVQRGEDATPGRLGESLNLSSPATTALLDRLNRAGHINRERSEQDRRQVHLSITDLAARTGKEMFAPLSRHIGEVIVGYSEEERALIERFVGEAIGATIAARDDDA